MIEVRDVHKELGEFSLRGVDLRIETGEYFVVLGPTGAGKTVLLECIAGLHKVDHGQVLLEGRDVTDVLPEHRNVAYVPQDYVLFPHISLRDNIGFSLSVRHAPRELIEGRVQQLAEMLGIGHLLDRRPRTLSGGEQQRGALARALAPSPTVLLLDEPLSALDEGTRGELIVELDAISRKTRTTVVHVCHNFEEALELADRIAIMDHGKVMQVGPPSEVFRKPCSPFVARFVGARNLFRVSSSDLLERSVSVVDGPSLKTAGLPDAPELLTSIRPEEISITRASGGEGTPSTDAHTNYLTCTVRRADDRGRFMHILLEGELDLTVAMTRQAFAAVDVSAGDAVIASFGREAVHVLPSAPKESGS